MIRAAVCTLLLIGASAPLALGENKLVWGYWIQRPTIASSLLGVDEVLGISSLGFDAAVGGAAGGDPRRWPLVPR